MSTTSIFFNGRLIRRPGSYSEVDASGLESVGLGASGIVAVLGTAIGGKPYDAVDVSDAKANMQVATRPQAAFDYFRSGNLKEVAPLVFGPANDADILAGAQEIVFAKVNPADQASANFDNSDGQALVLTSEDWGWFTNQINVEIANGTVQGKLITITFETTEEVFDDVGGDSVFTLTYLASTPSDGFTTITAQVTSAALIAVFTRDQGGLDADIANQVGAGTSPEIVSSNAADIGMEVTIYGTDATDATQSELLLLDGTTIVISTLTWNAIHGAYVSSGTPAGTALLRNNAVGTTIIADLDSGTDGLETTVDHAIAGTALTVVGDSATTDKVTLVGLSTTGAAQTEVLTLNGTTPVAGTALWARLDFLALGELAAARTVTVSGTSINALFSGYNTIQKLADKFNGTAGYTFTVVVGNPTTYLPTNLDWLAATNIKSASLATMYGNLYAIIAKINSESDLVTAAAGSVASNVPDNTTAPVFLTGGHEGSTTPGQEAIPTATTLDWTNALNLLKKVRVNSVVPLTGDPAVHALAKAHGTYMGGVGKSERDIFIGAQNAAQDNVPTKTEIKTQIVALNDRNVRVSGQYVERYNTSGDKEEFESYFQAAILAGMQAGSAVGTSLTNKYANTLSLRQDSTWNPIDDGEEMIAAGLCFMEVIDGIGRRIVRNVTTHLTDSNIAYTEGSVNEAVNYSVYNFRTTMERMVGQSGFAGSVGAAEGLALGILDQLMGISLVAYRSLDIQLILDVLEVSVEIAPVLPINFVKNVIHLVAVPQSATA